jgi:hypothetical protein
MLVMFGVIEHTVTRCAFEVMSADAFGSEGSASLPETDEDVLSHVFCIIVGAEDQSCRRYGCGKVTAIKGPEQPVIAQVLEATRGS